MVRKTHLLTLTVEARAPADVSAAQFSTAVREELRGLYVCRGLGDFDGVEMAARVSKASRRRVLP